jgi:O-antigen/teichoic acid export membrane protein
MKRYPLHFHSNFQLSLFISLIKRGGPLLIFTIITGLISTSDRIITSYFLGNKQLGYYSIAIMVFNFIMQVPGASRDIIEPKLMQELDKKPVEYNLNEYFFKPLINTAYYTPFLVGTAVIILPPFISLILPRYLPGILPAQIVVLGAYFYSVSYMARGVIVANNWQGEVSFFMVFVLIINIFLNILLIKLGLGLIGVAFSTALSYFILFVLLLSFIRLKYRGRIKNWGKNIEGILWPFPIMFLLLIISKYFLKGISTNRYFGSIINLFIFYICMIIVFKLAQKRYILLKGINLRERG